MAWTYNSKTGTLWDPTGEVIGYGYAGTGPGRNNPELEHMKALGPLPRGLYRIGLAYRHKSLGPVCMNLEPVGHDALGRSLFRIHGDNARHDASLGCIILSRALRELINRSADKEIKVV